MKSKFYAGFSFSPEIIKILKRSFEDEYAINVE
jgi:hypothetical protein